MELYNASTTGDLASIKHLLLTKKYSVTEEVSKETHNWTVLHYAAHYGHSEVVKFLLNHLSTHKNQFEIINLQTVEAKTPLFCAILSGSTNLETKQELIKLFFDSDMVDLTLRKSSGEDLLDLARKNSLYDYITGYCLRED